MSINRILWMSLVLGSIYCRIMPQGAADLLSSANLYYTLLVPVNQLSSVGVPAELTTLLTNAGVKEPVRLYIATQKTEVPVSSTEPQSIAETSSTGAATGTSGEATGQENIEL